MKEEKIRLINSILIAFLTEVQTLNLIITRVFPSTHGNALYVMFIISVLLSLMMFVVDKRRRHLNSWPFFLALIILFAFFISPKYNNVETDLTLTYLISFTIVPLLIPQLLRIDAKSLVVALMTIPSFAIFYLSQVFAISYDFNIGMDLSYAFMAPVVASFVYMFKYSKDDKGWQKLLMLTVFAINMVFFINLVLFGSRGPTLCVVLCVVFLIISRMDHNQIGVKSRSKSVLVIGIAAVIFIFSFNSIMTSAYHFISSRGIDSGTMEQMIRLLEEDNLVDGRDVISAITWEKIKESPILGYGLGCSPAIINKSYPHNFLLQLLLDGGFVLAIIVLYPLLVCLVRFFKRTIYDDYIIITVLFFSSVVGALFSLDMWMNLRLWLCFGFILSYQMSYNSRRIKHRTIF